MAEVQNEGCTEKAGPNLYRNLTVPVLTYDAYGSSMMMRDLLAYFAPWYMNRTPEGMKKVAGVIGAVLKRLELEGITPHTPYYSPLPKGDNGSDEASVVEDADPFTQQKMSQHADDATRQWRELDHVMKRAGFNVVTPCGPPQKMRELTQPCLACWLLSADATPIKVGCFARTICEDNVNRPKPYCVKHAPMIGQIYLHGGDPQ